MFGGRDCLAHPHTGGGAVSVRRPTACPSFPTIHAGIMVGNILNHESALPSWGWRGGRGDCVAHSQREASARDGDLGRVVEHVDEGIEGGGVLAEFLAGVESEEGHVPA